jgi:hypothetical protein
VKALDRHGWYLFALLALGAGAMIGAGLWVLESLKALDL